MSTHSVAHRGLFGRPVLTATVVLAALVGVGLSGVAVANRNAGAGPPRWVQPGISVRPTVTISQPPTAKSSATAVERITLSATGDIIMGSAPDRLPGNDGQGFFDAVAASLKADVVMGNLEQPLTVDTGATKCGSPPRPKCFAFRAPPSYAALLKDAGFRLLNTANNHARDFGAAGYRNTRASLREQNLRYTGSRDEITVVDVKGVKIAVVGFSSYAGANSLIDLAQARGVVRRAAEVADVVVVQAHMGAEGADRGRVKPGTETFFGENRGDPMTFSRTVVDAGADLVVGHGPHVLRGMEFYNGRLIAYSLGNFAGGGRTLNGSGVLGYGGILKVSLTRDGSWAGGTFLSTAMDPTGRPVRDTAEERGRRLVAERSAADFPATAAQIAGDGTIALAS